MAFHRLTEDVQVSSHSSAAAHFTLLDDPPEATRVPPHLPSSSALLISPPHRPLLPQVEPGALSTRAQLRDFSSRYYIFHYTYQFEYMLDGTPCQPWNIGEWSLDKRHFNDFHPAYPLPQVHPIAVRLTSDCRFDDHMIAV